MSLTDQQYILAGEVAHYISLGLDVALTSAAMLGWPSKAAYDSWWTSNGFCVVDSSAAPAIPTELLCYLSLTSSAIVAFALSRNSEKPERENPLLAERMRSVVFSNAAHGFGHAFLWLMGSAGSAIELSLEPTAVANLTMLLLFWIGTLRRVVKLPTEYAAAMSITVLTAQYLLRVPPELAFTYSQAVIFVGGSFDQLRRKGAYSSGGNSFLFFASSLYNLPLFALYYLEMFSCSESFLANFGGHAIYDLYLSLAPFALHYAVVNVSKTKID